MRPLPGPYCFSLVNAQVKELRVLQVGYGAFGETHARAWTALAPAALLIADVDADARARAARQFPGVEVVEDYRAALARCDAVDVLTPTDAHVAVAEAAIEMGRPLFIEKPVAPTAAAARRLWSAARRRGVAAQAGLYFRFHPKARDLKRRIAAGELGRPRYVSGRFAGLKRARRDSGALLNDAVHFVDLANWLIGEAPRLVYASCRDHFGRGSEDLAVLQLEYPGGAAALIETGYVQPGRWPDAVVPGAVTSKEIAFVGSDGVAEIDFAAETYRLQRGGHRLVDGLWRPVFSPPEAPDAPAADPVAVLMAEFAHFADCVVLKVPCEADLWDCGVVLAAITDAARRSAALRQAVAIDYGERA